MTAGLNGGSRLPQQMAGSAALAYANAIAVALATRQAGVTCVGCGHHPCQCVPVTPAELQAIRDALHAAITGAERPVLTAEDRGRLVVALGDAACWRKLSAYALCPACHAFPDDAVGLCEHNHADMDEAEAYERLARRLSAFPGWDSKTADATSEGAP